MPVNLYNLIKASLSDSNSPNILLTVSLADLHQLMVDTIDATRERLLPLFMKASEDRLLSKEGGGEEGSAIMDSKKSCR